MKFSPSLVISMLFIRQMLLTFNDKNVSEICEVNGTSNDENILPSLNNLFYDIYCAIQKSKGLRTGRIFLHISGEVLAAPTRTKQWLAETELVLIKSPHSST